MTLSLKRVGQFRDDEPVDGKLLNREINKVVKFINTNVEVTDPKELVDENRRRRPKHVHAYDDRPGDDGWNTPTAPDNPDKPKNPELSIRRRDDVAALAGAGVYPSISVGAERITKDHVGADVVIGTIPQGFTVRRIYWRVEEVFDNLNNKIDVKDDDGNILVYQYEIDLRTLNISDKPMDHEYTNYKNIVVHVYGSASTKGKIKITCQLEKVYKQHLLTT